MLTSKDIPKRLSRKKAIELSIQHHRELATCTQKEIKETFSYNVDGPSALNNENCALCSKYWKGKRGVRCLGCPLEKRNQDCYLSGSMYRWVLRAATDYYEYRGNHRSRQRYFREWQKQEREFVKLLESLR